jgi:predicted nucleotidyltransferase
VDDRVALHGAEAAAAGAAVEASADLAAVVILAAAAPEAVGKTMDQHLTSFIDDLKSTHGKNLVSVILYGSAVAGDHSAKHSDYNLLVVLGKIGPADLHNAHAAVREWAKLGHNVPVYFTADEISNAVDVFPIEFNQMKRARKVLVGTDLLADISISNENLRHQVEFELRSKLLMLRRQYIPASSTVEGLEALMADSLVSFIALFRGVLIIIGAEAPVRRHATLALTVDKLKLNGAAFEKIFNIRQNNYQGPMSETEANQLFAEYLEQIESVINFVDKLDGIEN